VRGNVLLAEEKEGLWYVNVSKEVVSCHCEKEKMAKDRVICHSCGRQEDVYVSDGQCMLKSTFGECLMWSVVVNNPFLLGCAARRVSWFLHRTVTACWLGAGGGEAVKATHRCSGCQKERLILS